MSSRSSSADEKNKTYHAELVQDDVYDPDFELSDEEKKRLDKALLRKLDLKLIPWVRFIRLVFAYILFTNSSFSSPSST